MDFIIDYFGEYVRADGQNVKIKKNPSLNILNYPPYRWYDHGTPRDGVKSGDAFTRVMAIDNCDFKIAVKTCKKYGIEPVKAYKYNDGYRVIRERTEEGGKKITLNKKLDGRSLQLYRLDEAMCHDIIYIVEGEKNVDDLWQINVPAVTSQGGSNSANKADWTPLLTKKTIIIPDRDEAGQKYCDYVLSQLPNTEIIELVGSDGYDISDYLVEGNKFSDLKPKDKNHRHIPIGFTDKTITVYSTYTKNYLEYACRPSEIKQFLFRIVPDWNYWLSYAMDEKGNVNKDKCAEKILLECMQSKNLTSIISRRGIGIYSDNGKIIANMGNRIFVDGIEKQYSEIDSQYFYISTKEKKISLSYSFDDAELFLDTIDKTSIDGFLNKLFFVGGIVSGYLSGLPLWKTHIWILAEPGSGKSSIADIVLKPVCAPCDGHVAVGNITEAGIRQSIGNNSNIFVHDEAETSQNIEKELELIRASSSGGVIVKGTQDQKGAEYTCSSLFYLLSISSSVTKLSDDDRFVYVNMKHTDNSQSDWEDVQKTFKKLSDSGFYNSLFNRCQSIAKNYIQSVAVFRNRFINTIGDKIECQQNRKPRVADKFASLVCGFWHFTNDEIITESFCDTVIEKLLLSPEIDSIKNDKQLVISTGMDALNAFLDTIISVKGNHISFRKLVLTKDNETLSSYSMCVTAEEDLFIRVKNKNITKIFKDNGYADYKKILGSLDGATVGSLYIKYHDFSGGFMQSSTRYGILIPKNLLEER